MDRVELLERKVEILESRLNAYGIPTEMWLSPEEASKILGFGRDKIISELVRAEKARINGERPDLIYGQHYTNGAVVASSRALWKVNAEKLREVLISTPPGSRPIYSWEKSQ